MNIRPLLPVHLTDRRRTLLLAVLVAILVLAAFHNRFMEDDAFISFRYADNFIHGNGLVWNPGERVEGYTNFLWTMVISFCMLAGWDPAVSSQIIGLCFFVVSLVSMYFLGTMIFRSRNVALAGVAVLGSNYTFNAFATSGLETQMQTALILLAALLWVRILLLNLSVRRDLAILSVLGAASVLTRPDSALIIGVLSAGGCMVLIRQPAGRRETIFRLLILIIPAALILGVWLVWKTLYYGNVLPNTFYSKIVSPTSPRRGLYYIHEFLWSYFLYPFLLVALFAVKKFFQKENVVLLLSCAVLFAWDAYIVLTGGDHMEFRFFVPVFPFMVILIVWLVFFWLRPAWVRAAFLLLLFAGTVYHALTFAASTDPEIAIAPLRQYEGFFTREDESWTAIGKTLHRAFPGRPDVRIATTAAGAIPFYSKLPTVDMLGINDPWVARYGRLMGTTPGHQRMAPMSYLVNRGVNLLIAHPVVVTSSSDIRQIPIAPMDSIVAFRDATFIIIPVDSVHKVVTMYLRQNPVVDKAIYDNHWEILNARIK